MIIFEADWICPISSAPLRNATLVVDGDRIAGLNSPAEGSNRISFPGCAIIPGFVNAHSHLELTILRGFLDDLPFETWIPRLTRAKYQQLSREEMLLSARLGAIEMLRAGVTCLAEVMDLGTGWEAMREFGLQGVAYQEVFGPAENQAEQSMAGLIEKVDKYRRNETETLRVGVSPHAPYTVSAKLFQAVNEYALRENLRLTTHIAESQEEGMFVRWGAGVFGERLAERGIEMTPPGCTPVEYIDRLGLARPEMLLVHVIDLEDRDFEILRSRQPAVVHCPKSNAKFGHGVARLPEIRDTGVPLGLGTDGVASNNVIDMFEEMRAAVFHQRAQAQRFDALDARTAFRMATLGAAECLGLSKDAGSLEAGKRADFVVVDLRDPGVQPVYDPIEAMVYSASRHNVRATYVGGQEVSIGVNVVNDVIRECASIAERLRRETGERE
jgi:cytosine/adenosine deaminase-related metal-dependent hydrolase